MVDCEKNIFTSSLITIQNLYTVSHAV